MAERPSPDPANRQNLALLVQLRWIACIGQVLTILIVEASLDIALPLMPMLYVVGFLVVLNLLSMIRLRRQDPVNQAVLMVALLLDVGALTMQLYLAGGATNPFIFLYLLQVILGAVLLEIGATLALVAVTSGCFIWLTTHYQPLVLPPDLGDALFSLHLRGMFASFLLTALLIVVFVTRIQRNLKDRDARIAELRQRAAEEDHIVRLGLLASGAAHELGTPLSTLSVILGDWRRMPLFARDADIAGEIADMQTEIERCKAIVSGILKSSGDVRGEGTLRTTLLAFLSETFDEWRASRGPGALEQQLDIAPDAPIISDIALKQVLFNVLDNALEVSPAWVGVAAEQRSDALVITVRDKGPGFDPAMLAELGTPYRSSKNRPGSGLGLFLVVNVMRKLGGTVSAANAAAGGAEIVLSLPLEALSAGGFDA